LGDVEALDFAGELAGEGTGVERLDGVDARLAGQQVGPALGHRISDGSDATESGHDNAAFGHAGKPFWDNTAISDLWRARVETPRRRPIRQWTANQAF
jgi:hypothetical protein